MPPRYWLSRFHPIAQMLRPVAWIFDKVRAAREKLYNWGVLQTHHLPVPVVVVGNVIAGGTGKTPVVIELVRRLQHMGYQPGVIARGYGRKSKDTQLVASNSTSSEVGDEPILIAHVCQAPVAVALKRIDAAKALLMAHPECDILISDDGLQHFALGREIEIVLFDERGVGNNWLLPSGPLREPWPRKPRCNAHLVLNDVPRTLASYALDETGQQFQLQSLKNQKLCALAGIAKPDQFFDMLHAQGLEITNTLSLPDHADFAKWSVLSKITANPDVIWLCTEKDAVKIWRQIPEQADRILAVPLIIDLDINFLSVFDVTIQSLMRPQRQG